MTDRGVATLERLRKKTPESAQKARQKPSRSSSSRLSPALCPAASAVIALGHRELACETATHDLAMDVQKPAARWIEFYWDEEDVLFFFELDEDG